MKKTNFCKAAVAAFLSLVVFACDPVQPEGNGGETPEPEVPEVPEEPVEVERSIKLYNADAEVETLEFTADATTYTVTVKANFQWDLDKDATTWPAWLEKLNESATGVLNETSKLYEGAVTLALDVENIASYYESKTGNVVFTDAEDLEYVFEFPVTHTFEKPAEPASILSNALGTNVLTVTTDGKIKGTDSNTLEITITPGEGQTGFKGFPVAYIDYPPYDESSFDWAPCVNAEKGTNSTYQPGHWVSLSENILRHMRIQPDQAECTIHTRFLCLYSHHQFMAVSHLPVQWIQLILQLYGGGTLTRLYLWLQINLEMFHICQFLRNHTRNTLSL